MNLSGLNIDGQAQGVMWSSIPAMRGSNLHLREGGSIFAHLAPLAGRCIRLVFVGLRQPQQDTAAFCLLAARSRNQQIKMDAHNDPAQRQCALPRRGGRKGEAG